MGKASSSKKIRRVQQAGVSRSPGQRRNLAYPALVAAIVVVGIVLVALARDSRQATATVSPTTRDHWHAAYATNLCGVAQGNPADAGPDRLGIHTHQDGLIHIHPFTASATGSNATFAKFAEAIGLTVTDDSIKMPDGTTKTNGQKCDGKKAEVALYVWPPQASDKTEPKKVTGSAINDVRFTENGQAFVLSFNPPDWKPKLPASMTELANPKDVEPGQSTGGLNSATTSVAPPSSAPTTASSQPTTTSAAATSTAPKATSTTTKPKG
ncbi:MAG: hypothetical protein JST64_12060 [Actinobacteria bacterium]|nr:hypothetical protein [Actinomycetota bacterium]